MKSCSAAKIHISMHLKIIYGKQRASWLREGAGAGAGLGGGSRDCDRDATGTGTGMNEGNARLNGQQTKCS